MNYSQLTYEQRYLIYKLLKMGFNFTRIGKEEQMKTQMS